jgi:hypothetical protein
VRLGISEEDISADFVVEPGVAIPPIRRHTVKYPFATMEVGDSFTCGVEDYNSVRVGCHIHGKKYGKKFSTRRTPSGGLRCWRIA